MDDKPLVSILINNYNYSNFLADSIDSALKQTHRKVEIIVVDDGSTDNSFEVINKYKDSIIAVAKENGGQGSAFNTGFKHSKGEIICFLDSDDFFNSKKVETIVSTFLEHPEIGWLFHDLEDVDAEGKIINLGRQITIPENSLIDFRQELVEGNMFPYFLPATTGLCFRRKLLTQMLPMPEQLKISADNFLRIAAIYTSPGYLSADKLAVHRIHGSNAFEFRKDIEVVIAKTNIETSYYIRKSFPETKAFADRLFAHSVGKLVGKSNVSQLLKIPEFEEYVRHFFSPFSDWKSVARVIFNYIKVVWNDSYSKLQRIGF